MSKCAFVWKKTNDDGDDEDGYDDGDGGYDEGQDVFVCKNISFSMNLNIYEYFSMSILFRNSIILIWICINWGGRMHTKTILQDAGIWYKNAVQCMKDKS